MAKSIALTDLVEVDGTNLSEFAHTWDPQSEHTEVDLSGFNSTGVDETLLGNTVQSATVEFWWSQEVHDVLYPAHRDKSIVTLKHRNDQNASASGSNPELSGNVRVQNYNPAAARGAGRTFAVKFVPADATGLVYSAT